MYNVITGQCTADIIAEINRQCIGKVNKQNSEITRNSNVHFNREKRFEFNHNFNRNCYVRTK